MAGDWIKMRVGLTTNPRVLRIAECLLEDARFLEWSALSYGVAGYPSPPAAEARAERHAALRVTRYVTVTALLKFWGYANEHAKGEFIAGVFPEDVDEVAGIPGFADAIEAAGWVDFDPDGGLSMPNFGEHNVSAGERSSGAERQKRYREKHKELDVPSDATRNVTRDVTVTHREEKKREEKKEQKTTPVGDLLTGVDAQIASDFIALRHKLRAPITKTAVDGIKREAAKAGLTLNSALAMCCERGWRGFKAEWVGTAPASRQRKAL